MNERPTSVRLDGRLLQALQNTANHMGIKRSALLRQCVRLGLAEVLKSEALIARVSRPDYKSTSIGEPNVVDVDYPELGEATDGRH